MDCFQRYKDKMKEYPKIIKVWIQSHLNLHAYLNDVFFLLGLHIFTLVMDFSVKKSSELIAMLKTQ